jgi:hypothetical protein
MYAPPLLSGSAHYKTIWVLEADNLVGVKGAVGLIAAIIGPETDEI